MAPHQHRDSLKVGSNDEYTHKVSEFDSLDLPWSLCAVAVMATTDDHTIALARSSACINTLCNARRHATCSLLCLHLIKMHLCPTLAPPSVRRIYLMVAWVAASLRPSLFWLNQGKCKVGRLVTTVRS